MDYLQIPFLSLLSVDHLIALLAGSADSLLSSGANLAVSGFSIFPEEFQGRAWNDFAASVEKAKNSGSVSDIYRQFIYLVMRVMAFMTFGFALYDSVMSLAGQGSAAEARGGKSKALSKNLLIIIVSVLVFEAEVVLNGIWSYLTRNPG